jgi:hypothetical protein
MLYLLDIAKEIGLGHYAYMDRSDYVRGGKTLGERMGRALETSQLRGNKSALMRAMDVAYSTVLEWLADKALPRIDALMAFCALTGVGVADLLDPEGRTVTEPQFEAWRQFLETDAGRGMTPRERKALASLHVEDMEEPDVGLYHALLAVLRSRPR